MSLIRRYEAEARRRARLLALAGTVAALLALVLGFYAGQQTAYSGMGVDPERFRELQLAKAQWAERELELQQQAEVRRTRQNVDLAALELVRRELAGHKDEISRLQEELNFYRSLMAPEQKGPGLSLRRLELVASSSPGTVHFRMVAQQEARKHLMLSGSLSLEVYGRQDGAETSLGLGQLSEAHEGDSIALRFRYFQAIEGDIELPPGFEPLGVKAVARITSPRKIEVREDYPWRVQETFSNVGQ